MQIQGLLFLFLVCLAGSFFFAGVETGFVSWNPVKLTHGALKGTLRSRWGVFLNYHKEQVLVAVLLGNNICNVGATLAFVGIFDYLIVHVAFFDLSIIPSPESWVLTPLVVFLGEIIPKSLFRIYSYRLTYFSLPLLLLVYFIAWPVSSLFNSVSSLFGKTRDAQALFTKSRQEMVLVAFEGVKRGALASAAAVFIDNLLRMHHKKRDAIDTTLCGHDSGVRIEHTAGEALRLLGTIKSNQVPVFDKSGAYCGYVLISDMIRYDSEYPITKLCKASPVLESENLIQQLLLKSAKDSGRFLASGTSTHVINVVDKNRFVKNLLLPVRG